MRAGDEEQRDADHRGAEHPCLPQEDEVADTGSRERAGNEDVPGCKDRPGAERHRRERKPEEDREQDERVAPPHTRPCRVRIGADDKEERTQNTEKLRHAVRQLSQLVAGESADAPRGTWTRTRAASRQSRRGCRGAGDRKTGGAAGR